MSDRIPVRRNRKAFTLVELLVVVSIIALLAALLLPGLSRAREYAYFTSCKSSLRQIGIGFLLFAGNNKGAMPEAWHRCHLPTGGWNPTDRRIGGYGGNWISGHGGQGQHLVYKIYDDDWNMNASWGCGTPGKPGLYLPTEAFWDPIVKVKDWGPWRTAGVTHDGHEVYAGSECCRDFLVTSKHALFGYAYFVHSVGCYTYQFLDRSDDKHVLKGYGGNATWWSNASSSTPNYPFRPTTRNTLAHTSNPGSVWLGACLLPIVEHSSLSRNMASHFGVRQTILGDFRFNVVHMDGSVHDAAWKEAFVEMHWGIKAGHNVTRPYGWPWRVDIGTGTGDEGVVEVPVFEGGYDRNKSQF